MLYIKNGEWALPFHKVIYKQHNETIEQYTHDKKWWNDFAEKWEHTEIIEFEDVTYSAEQTERLEEIKPYIEEGFEYYAWRYVVDGLFPCELDEGERLAQHPFKILKLENENIKLNETLNLMLSSGVDINE